MIKNRKCPGRVIAGLLFTPGWMSAWAQTLPITPDTGELGNTPVLSESHGVPVIQIAPPSAKGVSHNRYLEFNVGTGGVILNNGADVSQTQLGGEISGNPQLGGRHAAAILNQVTAANPSLLRGMLEVAGRSAHVIIANPAGITCDGCDWLNASRVTLTTGRPHIGTGGDLAFEITSGTLRIDGEGLKGANADQVDLLARALILNAGVWADRLNVVAGAAHVDLDTGQVRNIAGRGPQPEVALDASALGGMYANSIRLVGTEAGVGVNLGGTLAALTGDLTVSAAGDINITPHSTMIAKERLSLYTPAKADIRKATLRGDQIDIGAQQLRTGDGKLLGGDIRVNCQGDLVHLGAISAGGSAQLEARNIVNESGSLVQAGRVTVVARDELRSAGADFVGESVVLSSGGDMYLSADGHPAAVTPAQRIAFAGATHIQAGNLTMHAGNDIDMHQAYLAVDRDANMYAAQTIRLHDSLLSHPDIQGSPNHEARADQKALPDIAKLNALEPSRHVSNEPQQTNAIPRARELRLSAGRDIEISAGTVHDSTSFVQRDSTQGLLWSTIVDTTTSARSARARASMLSGQNVELLAGQDVVISGSDVGARNNLRITAGRDVSIVAAAHQKETRRVEQTRMTGAGVLSLLSIGRNTQTRTHQLNETRLDPSLIGSLTDSITIKGGHSVNVKSSGIVAPGGDITLVAPRVAIHHTPRPQRATENVEQLRTGVSVVVGTPILAAVQLMSEMAEGAEPSASRLLQTLPTGAAALAIDNTLSVIREQRAVPDGNFADYIGNIRTSLQVEAGMQAAETLTESTRVAPAFVTAGRRLTVHASGREAHLSVQASTLSSNGDVSLVSQGEIELRGARHEVEQKRTGGGSGGRIGIGASLSAAGPALGTHLGANYASMLSEAVDSDVIQARVQTGARLSASASSHMTLQGADVTAWHATANVGGDLNMESLGSGSQLVSEAKRMSAGGVIGVSLTGTISLADNAFHGSYASVKETTGVHAGSEGFDISVSGGTSLKGASITSAASDIDRNRFKTRTLRAENVIDHADHEAVARTLGAVKYTLAGGGVAPSFGWANRADKVQTVTPSIITGFASTLPQTPSQTVPLASVVSSHGAHADDDFKSELPHVHLMRPWDAERLSAQVDFEAGVMSTFMQQAGQTYRVYTHDAFKPGGVFSGQPLVALDDPTPHEATDMAPAWVPVRVSDAEVSILAGAR
ncbi:two-partner secretion domain-containing protein [Bordetella sp. 02P26C-1]|uniref:two-partner secretion domain-containing protein n=1 Tax=Bordetella sp. 02P26C-1 TaxID=2683195 RepID=UPI0013556A71|nr:hemagglutinin repeat-containing protein [Bordetella sp. 02P26C-1]MVW78824.1 filamentous hemagglutinin N-terminal domain-containing protein [Bordetella sp. 02P26C-1]